MAVWAMLFKLMCIDEQTFQLIRVCFEEDDGSRPGVELDGLSPDHVAEIYAWLRQRSRMVSESPELWLTAEDRAVALDDVPNAAERVAQGAAEAFTFWIGGLHNGRVLLPDLGVFVFSDAIELYWLMGPHWTRQTIGGFLELLHELHTLAPEARIELPDVERPPAAERFLAAWGAIPR